MGWREDYYKNVVFFYVSVAKLPSYPFFSLPGAPLWKIITMANLATESWTEGTRTHCVNATRRRRNFTAREKTAPARRLFQADISKKKTDRKFFIVSPSPGGVYEFESKRESS